MQEKGTRRLLAVGTGESGRVERGRLLAPRRVRRWPGDVEEGLDDFERVVAFVGTKLEVALVGVVQLKVAAEEGAMRMGREAGMRVMV